MGKRLGGSEYSKSKEPGIVLRKRVVWGSLAVTLLFFSFFWLKNAERGAGGEHGIKPIGLIQEVIENEEFGFNLDSFVVVKDRVKSGQFLANLLLPYNVPYAQIHALAEYANTVFDVRKIAAGNPYTLLFTRDTSSQLQYFIYQVDAVEYVVFALVDTVEVWRGEKEIVTTINTAAGQISTSLYDALMAEGENPMLSLKMAEILAWSVDFYRIQKKDWFKVIYEQHLVDGSPIGYGKILAIDFNHEGRDYYGFYFEQDSIGDYFDEEASSLRKAFLKSPLKYSRLSSGFTRRRFHPVQKRWKAHLGTDYAAPKGTPILATGSGKVIEARNKRFNGNYVKIKHNGTYQTQYLHMSSIKKGIKPGVVVNQGEVIGYVGSTGLATGPHVCYRFWKNGKQVNHLKEEFPPSEPVDEEYLEVFNQLVVRLKRELDEVELPVSSLAYTNN
jgi:murein DD-endopeptidase MepM/ murein hydrolase activator NlpD